MPTPIVPDDAQPNPWEGWNDESVASYADEIRAAAAKHGHHKLKSRRDWYYEHSPVWNKGDRDRPLNIEDFAVTLFAVEMVGESKHGLSYNRLSECFKHCLGSACHNNKTAALIRYLLDWELIAKVGNYSSGRRGNKYARVVKGQPPPPLVEPSYNDAPKVDPPADDMDDPW